MVGCHANLHPPSTTTLALGVKPGGNTYKACMQSKLTMLR